MFKSVTSAASVCWFSSTSKSSPDEASLSLAQFSNLLWALGVSPLSSSEVSCSLSSVSWPDRQIVHLLLPVRRGRFLFLLCCFSKAADAFPGASLWQFQQLRYKLNNKHDFSKTVISRAGKLKLPCLLTCLSSPTSSQRSDLLNYKQKNWN